MLTSNHMDKKRNGLLLRCHYYVKTKYRKYYFEKENVLMQHFGWSYFKHPICCKTSSNNLCVNRVDWSVTIFFIKIYSEVQRSENLRSFIEIGGLISGISWDILVLCVNSDRMALCKTFYKINRNVMFRVPLITTEVDCICFNFILGHVITCNSSGFIVV